MLYANSCIRYFYYRLSFIIYIIFITFTVCRSAQAQIIFSHLMMQVAISTILALSALLSPLFSCLYPLHFNCSSMQMSLRYCRGEKVGNQIGSNVIQFTKQGMNR